MTEIPFDPPGPMPFRLLLDEALRQARRHFRAIYPGVAIPVTILATAVAAAQAIWFARLKENVGTLGTPLLNPGYLGLVLVYSVLLMIAYSTLQVAVLDAVAGRPIDLRRAWRFTLRGRVLGTVLLWYWRPWPPCSAAACRRCSWRPLLAFVLAVMVEEGRSGFPGVLPQRPAHRPLPAGEVVEEPAGQGAPDDGRGRAPHLSGGPAGEPPLPAADVHRHVPPGRRRAGHRGRGLLLGLAAGAGAVPELPGQHGGLSLRLLRHRPAVPRHARAPGGERPPHRGRGGLPIVLVAAAMPTRRRRPGSPGPDPRRAGRRSGRSRPPTAPCSSACWRRAASSAPPCPPRARTWESSAGPPSRPW